MTIWSVLRVQLIYRYHLQRLQGLMPADLLAWGNVCRYFLQRSGEYFFISLVLFTNKTCFGRDGIISIHNQHQWTEEENPHQQQFSIHMWAGICWWLSGRPACFATSAYRQPLPRFPLTCSAKTTGRCTPGSQSTNVVHAWWCSGAF
jgi:hypothetical protein